MGRLLTDLLDVARIDAGNLPIAKQIRDTTAILAEVHRAYLPLFEGRGLALNIEGPSTELIASFDYDRILQVISNLLGNAMKFTPPGGSVFFHLESTDEEVVFVVRDTGVGVHPDALPKLFERFWQDDADKRRGLGLGLYLCRIIAEGHGGGISVQSELGVGTTFRVSLPVS